MVLLEFLGDQTGRLEIQLFGTDANERGIEKARAGIYEEHIAQEISPGRLRRFFSKLDEGYRVSKTVRDLCVFAKQNLAEDPPFSQMNLVACRNLLIYLGPELQKKVVPLLHYALRPSGFLMLGNAESAAAFPELFAPVDKKHKIFVKKLAASRSHYDFSAHRYPREIPFAALTKEEPASIDVDQQHEADRLVLKNYAPPGLVINENMEILQFRGSVGPYVEPASGKASLHLLKIARKELAVELRSAVNHAKKHRIPAKRKAVEFRHNGQKRAVNISVEPLGPSTDNRQYLVLFERTTIPTPLSKRTGKVRAAGRTAKGDVAQLRRKLSETEEHLRSLVESKEASDEEYQSANEEILSANEELQSTNEELETSKEELQSSNEELNTVNDELHNRNVELDRLNNDLNNLLASTTLPVIMVDRNMRIRRITHAAAKTLRTLPSDIGRQISDIRADINVQDLDKLIAGVIDTLVPVEVEVQDKQDHWYSLQIRPYRTLEDKIDGVVLLLSDVDGAKKISERIKRSQERLQDVLDTVREPSAALAEDMEVLYANTSFLKDFDLGREETNGKLFFRLVKGKGDMPELRTALEEVISLNIPLVNYEVKCDLPSLGPRTMMLSARRIENVHNDQPMVLVAIEDVSERQEAERQLRESEGRYRTLFELGPIAVYSCDASGVIQEFNARAEELWGRKPNPGDTDERFCGSFKMHTPEGIFMPHEQCPMAEVLSGKLPLAKDMEVQIERPDGSRVTVLVNIRPLKNEREEITGAINCFVDITERKQMEAGRSRLAAIVEFSDDAMVSKTLDGTITSWNKAAERLFGYAAEEAIGQNITLIVPADRLPEEKTILERLTRGERVEHFETVRRRKDGTTLDVSLTISPVKDAAGRVVGASKVARDITTQKQTEQALRQAHDRLESLVEIRTAAVRKLSSEILRSQDEERRRISRELHDSVGQHLAHVKMSMETLARPDATKKEAETLAHVIDTLDKCLTETRTISYLLHPPLLDEVGFASAAKWYVEGFSKRSGIQVKLTMPPQLKRLPGALELVLFRILQESLTNVHRHAETQTVDAQLDLNSDGIVLEVRDHGKGMPAGLIDRFRVSGEGVGVGLSSMRERVNEIGGIFEIRSDTKGTVIRAAVPLSVKSQKTAAAKD